MPGKGKSIDTAKKEAFAQKYVECGNASEAYRHAYDVSDDTLTTSVTEQASVLMKDLNVTSMVFKLQEAARERNQVTIDSLTNMQFEAYDMAKSSKQPAAMSGATMGVAKLHGLDVQKVDFIHPMTIMIAKGNEDL